MYTIQIRNELNKILNESYYYKSSNKIKASNC